MEQMIAYLKKGYENLESTFSKKKWLWWTISITICASILFALNVLTPLISDDFAYLFIYGTPQQTASLSDIVQSQINHYYMWGGRSVVHFIAQVLLILPAYVADLLNTFVYIGYASLIYYHIKGRGKNSLSLFILINLAVWFLQPVFGDTILWITGAANYLWGTFFILLFLLPFRLYEDNKQSLWGNVLYTILLFVLGIIAGWTNENTAGAMLLMAILFFFYYRSQQWQIPAWLISGFAGAIVGYAFMILAPGNFERAGETSFSLFLIAYRLFNSTLTFVYYAAPAILIAVILLPLYSHFCCSDKRRTLILTLIYYIGALAAVYAMMLSPTFPRRALFGVVTYLIIGAGILFYNLDFNEKFLRQIRFSLIAVGLLVFILHPIWL